MACDVSPVAMFYKKIQRVTLCYTILQYVVKFSYNMFLYVKMWFNMVTICHKMDTKCNNMIEHGIKWLQAQCAVTPRCNMLQLEVRGPSGPQLLVGGPSGQLDYVLRALRALRPCDPHNDVVIG